MCIRRENIDIFPISTVEKQRGYQCWEYVDLNMLNRILETPLVDSGGREQKDLKAFADQVDQHKELKPLRDIYVLIQVDYTAFGGKRSYSYWVIYKTNNRKIKTINSGSSRRLRTPDLFLKQNE